MGYKQPQEHPVSTKTASISPTHAASTFLLDKTDVGSCHSFYLMDEGEARLWELLTTFLHKKKKKKKAKRLTCCHREGLGVGEC